MPMSHRRKLRLGEVKQFASSTHEIRARVWIQQLSERRAYAFNHYARDWKPIVSDKILTMTIFGQQLFSFFYVLVMTITVLLKSQEISCKNSDVWLLFTKLEDLVTSVLCLKKPKSHRAEKCLAFTWGVNTPVCLSTLSILQYFSDVTIHQNHLEIAGSRPELLIQ